MGYVKNDFKGADRPNPVVLGRFLVVPSYPLAFADIREYTTCDPGEIGSSAVDQEYHPVLSRRKWILLGQISKLCKPSVKPTCDDCELT